MHTAILIARIAERMQHTTSSREKICRVVAEVRQEFKDAGEIDYSDPDKRLRAYAGIIVLLEGVLDFEQQREPELP